MRYNSLFSGFRREHVRIQINHILGFMVISGEYPLDGTRRRHFKKEIELSTHCNVDAIHANFSQGILSVVMPKKIPQIYQEEQERQIPETEQEKENETYQYMEFRGGSTKEDTETTTKEAHTYYTTDNHFIKNDEELTLETTREIALKFMVVIIVILVIVNYLADMSKSLMAHAQSYFHD